MVGTAFIIFMQGCGVACEDIQTLGSMGRLDHCGGCGVRNNLPDGGAARHAIRLGSTHFPRQLLARHGRHRARLMERPLARLGPPPVHRATSTLR